MAEIKDNNQDREEGVRGTLLTQKDNEKQLSKLDGLEFAQVDTTGNAPAKSQKSSGRNCPSCSNRLTYIETTDAGNWLVKCTGCHKTWVSEQLQSLDSDWLFRQIPEDLKMRWMKAREEELKRKGEW